MITFVRPVVEGGLLLTGLCMTALGRSPRWALAAAIYVVPGEISTIVNLPLALGSRMVTAYWIVLAVLVAAMAGTACTVRPEPADGGS